MGNSLFDQLNKTGLVGKNQAKQTKKSKYQQARKKKGKQTMALSESQIRVQQVQVESAQRDRELNQQQKFATEKKSIAAQIKQLVEMNFIPVDEADITFNFVDGKNVQRIIVTGKQQELLTRGRLAIVKLGVEYNLVPAGVAEKIRLRDVSCVVHCAVSEPDTGEIDDPYVDYKVPDDLMW